jgi:hypothetical protein
MRKLSVSQKKVITQAIKGTRGINFYDDLPNDVQTKIETLNMYENLESDVDRFINDLRTEWSYN